MRILMAMVIALVSSIAASQTDIDYDSFFQQDTQARLKAFNAISPENRASLVRAHLERWVAANRERLTPEQLAFTEDSLAAVHPDAYRETTRDAYRPQLKALEERGFRLLSYEDMRALTIFGDYVPRK